MTKDNWKSLVFKSKWASGKKRLGKKELAILMTGALALEKLMGANKSCFANADRREHRERK
ncbi:MAG: hypothetical protein AAB922_05360 [Patescibacteria group bacterium]